MNRGENGWKRKPLVEVATLQRGFDLPVQRRRDGPIVIYAANGPVGTHNEHKVKGPGVVTGRSGTLGAVHYVDEDFWPLNTALWVKDFHGNHPRWVARLLRWMKLEQFTRGAGVPTLNRNLVHVVEVDLPPLAEQKRIAGILDAADALRAKRRAALGELDALLKSAFLDLFGDPVTNPMGWKEVPIGEIVAESKLGMVRSSKEFGWDYPTPYVRMDALTVDGKFLPEKVQLTKASSKEMEAFALRSGDLLFNTRNSQELVGKVCVFPGPDGWLFNNNLMRIRFCESVEPTVIAAQFLFRRVQQELEQRKSGTTSVFAVYWKSLRTLPVLVPSMDLQCRFAAIVESVEQQKTRMRSHLSELDALFASLQSRAFNGEL